MNTLNLQILTPRIPVFQADIQEVTIPAEEGEMCVLPGHVSFASKLDYGVVSYLKDNEEKKIAVHLGFFYVKDNRVIIMADRGEQMDLIDKERAKQAEERARQKLSELDGERESSNLVKKYEAKLKRALVRGNSAQ